MKINIRHITGEYCEVIIEEGNTIIDMGFLSTKEQTELRETLLEALTELKHE